MPVEAIRVLWAAIQSRKFSIEAIKAAYTVVVWLLDTIKATPVPSPAPAPSPSTPDVPVLRLSTFDGETVIRELAEADNDAMPQKLFNLPAKLLLQWIIANYGQMLIDELANILAAPEGE